MKIRMGVLVSVWVAIVVFTVVGGGLGVAVEAVAKASFWCLVFHKLWSMVAPSDETRAIPMAPKPFKRVSWVAGTKQTLFR